MPCRLKCNQDWDKPEKIPDPDATKPNDWDTEMDGEWEHPLIQNIEYKVNTELSFPYEITIYYQYIFMRGSLTF